MTTLLSAANFRGSKTLVANFFGQPGKGFCFHAKGYSSALNPEPEFIFTLGGTTIWDSGSVTGWRMWSLELDVICVTTGAPGSVRATGKFLIQETAGGGVLWLSGSNLHASYIAVTTTGALAIDLDCTLAGATGYVYCSSAWLEEFD